MRRAVLLAMFAVGVVAAVACASSEDEGTAPGPDPDTDAAEIPDLLPDGGGPTDGRTPIRDASTCSDDGWCITALPQRGLILKDIWPFESRAFAIAEHANFGIKVLEWDEAEKTWKYIDDNSQNEYDLGNFAGNIWTPNENEVYYAVGAGIIYHGRREAPSAPWSWEQSRLADNSRDTNPNHAHDLAYANPNPSSDSRTSGPTTFPAIGVWGTSGDDIYAWYANTIFHRKSEGGAAPAWVPEYVLDDSDTPSDTLYVFSATASGPDDIWFAGGRVRYNGSTSRGCPIAIHKTANTYQRVIDTVHTGSSCRHKADALGLFVGVWIDLPPRFDAGHYFLPSTSTAWLTSITSAGPNTIVGLINGQDFAYVTLEDGGAARLVNVLGLNAPSQDIYPMLLNSVWRHEKDVWVAGWGLLLRLDNDPVRLGTGLNLGTSPQADGGYYTFSTAAINGLPLDAALYRVRGTSNTNLWAIGAQYALHKTTP